MKYNRYKINSIEELRDAISEFKKLKDVTDYNVLRKRYFDLFNVFPFPIMFHEAQKLNHLPIYRARPAEEVLKCGKNNVESFMGPPKLKKGLSNGRANWNGRNVFYAGDSPYVTIVENKQVEINKEYFVGQWEIDVDKLDEDQIPIAFLTLNNLTDNNPWSSILPSKDSLKKTLNENGKFENLQAELFVELISELSTLFYEDEGKYNLSAFIADNLLYGKRKEKFRPTLLLYPSKEANKIKCNIAIHPDFAKKYLRIVKVIKFTVADIKRDEFKANYGEIGQLEQGKIQFYHLEINPDKAMYEIDYLRCECGETFDIQDPDKFYISENNRNLTIRELIDRESLKWISNFDLQSYDETLFEDKPLAIAKVLKVTIPFPNTYISNAKNIHTRLYCQITVTQPFEYIKENKLEFAKPQFIEPLSITKSN